jgi:hypothetical protein
MKRSNLFLEKNKSINSMRGSALAYALVIMFVVSIILTSMVTYIVAQLKFSLNRADRAEAFQIAEAGVYYYRWYLAHETSGKTAQQIQDFWNTGNPLGVNTPATVDYNGLGQYKIEVTKPSQGSTIVIVKSTGWTYKDTNSTRTVQVRFRRPSWSEYVFLSNSFMNFGNQAEVWGKVFSNGGIRFDGIAHNEVDSLLPSFDDPTWGGNRLQFGVHTTINPADPDAPSYPWPNGTVPSRPGIFMGGRNFPAPQVSFTGVTTDLANMKTQAQSGKGKYFDNSGLGRKILLKSNGTYDVCTVSSANSSTHVIGKFAKTSGNGTCNTCSGDCLSNFPIVNNGVIFVENNAWVDGTVNGKAISIVAANLSGGGSQADIYIGTENSNLSYASFDCTNKIGLVAQRDVRVLGSCPADYIVDAALLAQTGTVGINDNGFSDKTSLTFNGAIASYLEPYFQHGNSGFAVRFYNFDNDLLYCPPPYFPTGTEYSIDLWEEL